MEKLLANDNYDGVITLHEKISKTTPVLLQFGRLTGMKLEAERLKKLRDERIENIKKLFEACFKEIAQAEPRLSEMKYLQGEIAKLRTDDLPSDMITQLQNINFKVRNLEFQAKRKNEDSFVASEEKLMNELEQLAQKMNDPSENPQLIRSRINDIINRMNTLNRQASDIDKKLRQERSGLINSRAQTLLTQLDNIAKRREIIRNLHTPDTFFKYMEELKNLSAQAPDLAIGEWKEALRQLPTVQGLYAGASLGNNYLTHQALEQKLSGIAVDMQNNCFVKDITMMLPDKYFRDNLKQVQDRLYAEFAMLYNCYELVFQDENNALWRFYSTEKPIFDRSYSSNTPKAIEINVLKKPGTPGYPLPITVSYKSKSKVAFIPDKLPGIALPVKFVKLVNVPVTSIRYPKAEHYELLAELLRELKRVKTPEALESCIIQILQKLQNSDNMNIFARAALTRKTLDILPLVTPFYAQLTSESNIALDRSALHLYENWYNPAAEIEHATAAGELRKFFKNFSPEKLQKTCHFMRKVYMQSQNRGLSPGGIILRTAHKRAKVHWFTGAKHVQEMWFYAPPAMGESPRWIMFTQKDLTNGNSLTMTRFAGYTGMVFFVPFDEQSTVNLTKQILRQQQAEKLLEFTWPACWPQNYR